MPKFPGVLLNNNPNAPSLDLNDLQVKGVGIFADVAERDALDTNIQTEGYLSIMKNDDNVYVYKGGGWTTPANWEKISGTIGFTDNDGNPLGEVSTLVFPEGSISIVGSNGVIAFTAGGTSTDTTNFNGVLSSADTTVQAALDTLDGLSLTLEGLGDTPTGYGTAGQVLITNGVDGFTFGSGSPWDEVAYTNDTAIKYENGVVGLKDSAVTYPTSGNLWSKVRNFPIDRDAQNISYATDALMHLHEGRILLTTENTTAEFTGLTITNARHSAAYSMSIGMESNFGTITGNSGIRMKPSGQAIMEFAYSNSGSTLQKIAVSNNLPVQNASTNRMGINMGQSVLMLSGEILFYGHSANVFSAIKPRGYYATNSGVSIASPRSGYFAHFAASDGNTVGSYGYLGINVDNPTPTGPAFEVSSSYAKFNNGLHIGDITTTGYAFPTATGTTGQLLQVDANGDLGFVTFQGSPWDENASGITYDNGGSVAIISSTDTYQGNIITSLFGSSQSAPGGSRAARKLLHLHEGQLIFSTETNTPISHIEMSNQSHSSAVGGAIGTSPYNMRIHGYHALEFSHGGNDFTQGSMMVNMDMPSSSANTGSISIGRIDSNLGGIQLPSFGPGTVNTTNYSLLMGGRIRFVNHSSIKWDAITQGPSSYAGAGVALSSFRSSNILVAVSSDSNTAGSYGYVGINTHSPSATGPAFEVSSSYAKFNDGLHIGDITTTGYAFPTATGTTGQLLQVDANGDLGFVTFQGSPWVSDTNGITYTAGSVGIGTASVADYPLAVSGKMAIGYLQDSVIIGNGAGSNLTAANESVIIGHDARTTGGTNSQREVVIGARAISSQGVAIGYEAVGGTYGVTIGTGAGPAGVAVGGGAGANNTGTLNTYVGGSAGDSITSGQANVIVGHDADGAATNSGQTVFGAQAVSSGTGAIAVGRLADSTSGISIGQQSKATSGGLSIGFLAGSNLTSGTDNIIIGTGSAGNVTTASNSVIIGHEAVSGSTAWNHSGAVAIGHQAGKNVNAAGSTGQGGGVFIGSNSGNWSQSYYGSNVNIGTRAGNAGVAIGEDAGYNGGGGLYDVVIGRQARGGGIVIGGGAVGGGKVTIGAQSSATGNNAIAIGGTANYQFSQAIGGTTGGNYAVSIGANVAQINSVSIGYTLIGNSSNTIQIGTFNGAYHGNQASTGTPTDNILLGNSVLSHNASANANAITNYTSNVLLGSAIGQYPSGSFASNVIIGQSAYSGGLSSYSTQTGSNNVIIGKGAGAGLGANVGGSNLRPLSGNVLIGYNVAQDQAISNKLYIANSNTTTPLIYGDFDDGYVTINKNGTDKISFYAGSHAYQIADADYAGNYVSGAVSNNKGLYILFEGTGLEQSGVYRNGGLWMGRAWNFGADPGSAGGGVMLGNRITATATSGNSWLPGVLIGSDVDLGSNNHAGGVLIGNVSPSGAANGVTIHSGTGTKPSAGTASTVIINSTSGTSAIESVAIGGRAWGYSVSIGSQAQLNSTGNNPGVFIGRQAARYENGQLSTIVGYGAGYNINGGGNTALGASAAYGGASQGDSFSRYNTAVGASSLYSIFGGDENVAVGYRAGYRVTSGNNNVFVGKDAGYNVTTGAGNTIIGTNSYGNANLGSSNVIIGNLAGGTAYDGSDSVMIGRQANVSAGLTNARAVAIGYTANVSGSKGVAIGDSNAKGGAVAIGGASAGYNDVSIGPGAGGNRSSLSPHSGHGTYIGYASGGNGTGNGIIIGGINAATSAAISGSIGIGSYTFAGATDSDSVGIGAYAGRSSSGQRNMYLGMNAGWNTTGDYNVFLGYNNNITRTVSGSVHIGNLAGSQETTSNKLYIANSNTTTPLVYGEFDTPLLNVNGELQVNGDPIYTGKYTSVSDGHVGNQNTDSTGNTIHVETYYTRSFDGDGLSSSEYTGTGVRRIYYSNKFNADPTTIDSNDNPDGWEVIDGADVNLSNSSDPQQFNTFVNTFAASKDALVEQTQTYEHIEGQFSIAVAAIPTKISITTTAANEVFKFDICPEANGTSSTRNPYALCTVNWGDGTSDTVYSHRVYGVSNSYFIHQATSISIEGTLLTAVTHDDAIWNHTYATPGNYTITVTGGVQGLSFYQNTQITSMNFGNQVRFGTFTFKDATNLQTFNGRLFYEQAHDRSASTEPNRIVEGCTSLAANQNIDNWFSPTNKQYANEFLTAYWGSTGIPANLDTLRAGKNIKVTNPQFGNWRPTNGNIPYINFDWTEVTAVFARSATVNRLPMAEGLEPKAEQVISLNESFSGNATDLGPELLRMSKNKPFLNNFRRAFMATGYSHYGTFRVSEASVWYGSAEIHGNGSFYTTPGTFVPWFIVEGGYGNTGSSFTASTSGRTFIAGDFDTDLSSMASIVGRYSTLSSALSSNYYFKGKGLENWDVSNVTSFSSMFVRALRCNPDISRWDVSSAQNMNSMFSMASSFNSDIGEWDVRNVTDMTSMFSYAASFNQDISRWDTSSCLLASKMFTVADNGYWQGQTGAYSNNFNQDVGTKVAYRRGTSTTSEYTAWDVSSITTMEYMFSGYSSSYNSFNNGGSNSIQYWDTSSVTAMKFMFYNTRVFNQPLTSQTVTHTTLPDYTSWDVSNVTSFQGVFQNALAFNQDLSSWTPTLVTTYREMFRGAVSFDGDLSGWITASSPVTSFNSMFLGANAFTGTGLDGWVMPTGQDFTCNTMFANCTVFNKDVSSWVMTRCTDMTSMFQSTIFNHDISGWDTSNVTSLKQMFYNNNSFNQDISSWSIASIPDGNLSTSDFMYSMFAAQSGGITGLSAANLSAIFVSWESQVAAGNGPINMRLGRIPSVTLTTAGQTAKDSLANSYGWQFT
jgi:surface protein